MTVGAVDDRPSGSQFIMPSDTIAVDLMSHDCPGTFGDSGTEAAPALHYGTDRLLSPEPQVEWTIRVAPPAGNPGDHPKAFAPARNLPKRYWAG